VAGVAAVVAAIRLRIRSLRLPDGAKAGCVLAERLPVFRIRLVAAAVLMDLMVPVGL
jgi:hypothetical protein